MYLNYVFMSENPTYFDSSGKLFTTEHPYTCIFPKGLSGVHSLKKVELFDLWPPYLALQYTNHSKPLCYTLRVPQGFDLDVLRQSHGP